jgi:hypothetical protein
VLVKELPKNTCNLYNLKNKNTGEKTTLYYDPFWKRFRIQWFCCSLFTKQIANGGPITITHPDIIRYFMTIPEACQLVLEAAMGNGGGIYIFDMGKPKIVDLARKMIKLAGFVPEGISKYKL